MRAVFGALVAVCCRRAFTVMGLFLIAAVLAGFYTAGNFAMNSDSSKLISQDVPFRQHEAKFDALFPGNDDLILVVIDGATPERAERAAAELTAKLKTAPDMFPQVRRPDGGDFFAKSGLLYLPLSDVRATMSGLIQAQPFLGPLAADPSLRGIMHALDTALLGVEGGQASLADLQKPIAKIGDTLSRVIENKPAYLSWQEMMGAGAADDTTMRTRRFIEVHPKLNFGDLTPGVMASDAIRADARALGLTEANGMRVRLTGPVPMADEEFATLAQRAGLMGTVMMAAVLLMFWLAVRSFKIIVAIVATLIVGLLLTTAIGLFAVGVFNIISVAFIALFVGLGVDFGIQFCVRYRHERHIYHDLKPALTAAGRTIGPSLFFAAAATAAGFLSFLPTAYSGVAELGLVAGIGMGIAFALSITLLPALLTILRPAGEAREVGFHMLAPLDLYVAHHRRRVLTIAGVLALLSLALMPFLRFDFNPLNLRSAKVESVSTLLDLMKSPETSPNTIDVLAPNLTAANAKAEKLSHLPQVAQAITLNSFVPENQAPKLAAIHDAASLLDTTLDPFMTAPPPSDAQVIAAFRKTAASLRKAADKGGPAANDANRLADALETIANGNADLRAKARASLVPDLKTMLAQLQLAMQAAPVDLQTLPADLKRQWVAKNGEARVQVSPAGDSNNNAVLEKFAAAVLALAPNATGAPISIQESGKTILTAFVEAGALSFVAIVLLLGFALGRARDVTMTMLPLLLTGLLTLATCVIIDLPLNFANVIALPLLFGIGVAFNIYFVLAWRGGTQHLLQTSLARAVLFSAATTASAFGSLWLSSHPGTASMGELLMISLAWTLVTTWFVLPALLGPTPAMRKRA